MTSKPTETELLPCPFCGRLPAMKRVPSKSQSAFYWWVGCEIAGTPAKDLVGCGIGHSAWSEPEAAAKWNTRTPSPTPSSAEARARAQNIVGASLCGHDDCPNADAVHTSELVDRIASALSTPQPTLQQARDVCWHCGVVLSVASKPRCEDCPDECDVEDCEADGCNGVVFNVPTLQQAIECVKQWANKWYHAPNDVALSELTVGLSSLASIQE